MKKSTLITTIAMIVVVVVALSTATYAWFSAQSTNKVTATVGTTGSGDFAISQATVGEPAAQTGIASLTNWTAAATAIEIDNDLMEGLYAPTAELTAANYGISGTSATKNTGKFYLATSGDNNTTATISTGATYFKPTVLRIQNTSGEPKQLKVYVDINVGDGTNSANVFAGESIAFVMICQNNDQTFSTAATLSSGYSFGGTLSPSGEATYAATETITSPSTATIANNPYTRMAYDGLTTSVGTVLGSNDTAESGRGGVAGDYINTQSLTISSNLPNSGVIYVTLYLWIDGWRADNSAAGADSLKVGFRFYGDAVSQG